MYPALSVYEALKSKHPNVETLWVGGEGGMEEDLVKRAGIPYRSVPAAGVHGVGLRALPDAGAGDGGRRAPHLRYARGHGRPDPCFRFGGLAARRRRNLHAAAARLAGQQTVPWRSSALSRC